MCDVHDVCYPLFYYTSHSVVPALLQTSQEARTVGLQHYKLDFGVQLKGEEGLASVTIYVPPNIYVNWECDIICPMLQALDSKVDQEAIFEIVFARKNLFRIAFDSSMIDYFDELLESNSLMEIILYLTIYDGGSFSVGHYSSWN